MRNVQNIQVGDVITAEKATDGYHLVISKAKDGAFRLISLGDDQFHPVTLGRQKTTDVRSVSDLGRVQRVTRFKRSVVFSRR